MSSTNDVTVESTFEVDRPPAALWEALADAARARGASGWWLPGFEAAADEIRSEAPLRATLRKADQPCRGTTITLDFVPNASGTRVTVSQTGFDPAFVEAAGPAFFEHGGLMLAGLEEFLRGTY